MGTTQVRLLLDTHVWLWVLAEPERIAERTRDAIETAAELTLSVASLWEIGIKQGLGKLDYAGGVAGLGSAQQSSNKAAESSRFERSTCSRCRALPWHHRDPFDRMLVAQADVEQLTLVTADAQIKRYDGAVLWAI